MTKKSILEGFQPKMKNGVHDTFTGAIGKMYKFVITFANGDTGDILSTKEQPTWSIGTEYSYDISEREYNGRISYLIKNLKTDKYNTTSTSFKSIEEWQSHAMQVAIEITSIYYLNRNENHDYSDKMIDTIYNWIEGVVNGNDKMYWRAFSIIKSSMNFLLSPSTKMKKISDMLLLANSLFAKCDIETKNPVKEVPVTSNIKHNIEQEAVVYPEDDNNEMPF